MKTIKISEKNAKRYQKAFTKKGIVQKEILGALKDANIELKGEIIGLSPFSEAGEANINTTHQKLFIVIDW